MDTSQTAPVIAAACVLVTCCWLVYVVQDNREHYVRHLDRL